MTNVTITLPATYAITSRDTGVECDIAKLPVDIVAKLALHGLFQKVGDSAAGALAAAGHGDKGDGKKYGDLTDTEKANVQAKAREAMNETLTALYEGDWTERTAAESVDPRVAKVRAVFGAWMRNDDAENKTANWKTHFKGLDAKERGPALDAALAEQEPAFIAAIEAEADAQIAAEAKAKARIGKLTLKVNLPK